MTRKGGVATCEALARQGSSLRFLQRHAGVSGRGMDPCPEPESGAVLLLGKRSAQAPGIVTRKGGDINSVNGSVSAANRARKGAQLDLFAEQLVTPAATVITGDVVGDDRGMLSIRFDDTDHFVALDGEGKRMKTMKPGTRLNPLSSMGHWEGVLRDGSGRVVWACGHLHKCRDQTSRIHGKAARRCAEEALRLLKTE